MKQEISDELRDFGSSLGGQRIDMPFSVPDGYFSGLSDRVVAAVEQQDADSLLPQSVNPYTVPAGYFDELPARMSKHVAVKARKGVLITFGQLRWAAAAVLLIMVSAAAYTTVNSGRAASYDSEFLASVADDDIKDYLGYAYQGDVAKALPTIKLDVAPSEIEAYLDETGWGNENL